MTYEEFKSIVEANETVKQYAGFGEDETYVIMSDDYSSFRCKPNLDLTEDELTDAVKGLENEIDTYMEDDLGGYETPIKCLIDAYTDTKGAMFTESNGKDLPSVRIKMIAESNDPANNYDTDGSQRVIYDVQTLSQIDSIKVMKTFARGKIVDMFVPYAVDVKAEIGAADESKYAVTEHKLQLLTHATWEIGCDSELDYILSPSIENHLTTEYSEINEFDASVLSFSINGYGEYVKESTVVGRYVCGFNKVTVIVELVDSEIDVMGEIGDINVCDTESVNSVVDLIRRLK